MPYSSVHGFLQANPHHDSNLQFSAAQNTSIGKKNRGWTENIWHFLLRFFDFWAFIAV
jgi:hypothetical protein